MELRALGIPGSKKGRETHSPSPYKPSSFGGEHPGGSTIGVTTLLPLHGGIIDIYYIRGNRKS